VGKDKFENELLIAHGWPEDVWFHVDDLSSAHVYVRLKPGMTIASIPEQTLEDCATLVKENSIEGCKLAAVKVVYTPWANLKKEARMDTGQVGFVDSSQCRFVTGTKNKAVLKELMRTREERTPDLAKERAARDAEVLRREKAERKAEFERRKAEEEEARRKRVETGYERAFAATEKSKAAFVAGDVGDDAAEDGAAGGGGAAPSSHAKPAVDDLFGGGASAAAPSKPKAKAAAAPSRGREAALVDDLFGIDSGPVLDDRPKKKGEKAKPSPDSSCPSNVTEGH
jgi:hypothetical protein